MPAGRRNRTALLIGLAGALALATVVVIVIAGSESLPEGPQPVVWDRTPCAECRMAVSEWGFAAQLQTTDGRVLDFDDCGCLFRFLDQEDPSVHALWFHHLREERWISGAEVTFVEARPSPMGFNLGAMPAGTEGGLSLDEARAKVRRPRRPGGHASP